MCCGFSVWILLLGTHHETCDCNACKLAKIITRLRYLIAWIQYGLLLYLGGLYDGMLCVCEHGSSYICV